MQASIDFDGTLTGSIARGGGGSDVSITPTYHQGVKIADYSIDGNEGAIYTPEIEITKYVSSGVKICEINDVEIFAPSYGYIDTLGDSNVEQIGGFSQGANVTPVNVKKVSYTNDVNNGEKIGTLTVGDTTYNVYQKQNSDINYSLTEQDTGMKWVDGKTIYQRTAYATAQTHLTNTAWSTIPWNSSFTNVAYLIEAVQHGVSPNTYQQIRFSADSGTIKAAAAVSDIYPPTLSSNQYVTFYYTKTE